MNVTIEPCVFEDVIAIFDNLREPDAKGIELLGIDGQQKLEEEILMSTFCYTGKVDGKIAVIWGVRQPSLLSAEGYVWMLTSKEADKVPFIFARYSRRNLEKLLEKIPVISGTCFAFNERSLRWIRWLGAEIAPLKVIEGIPTYNFQFRRV